MPLQNNLIQRYDRSSPFFSQPINLASISPKSFDESMRMYPLKGCWNCRPRSRIPTIKKIVMGAATMANVPMSEKKEIGASIIKEIVVIVIKCEYATCNPPPSADKSVKVPRLLRKRTSSRSKFTWNATFSFFTSE